MSAGWGPSSITSREELGRALTELRVARNLSVRDVAAESDALLGTVAGWFAGQHAPTRASREMFDRVLGVCGVTAAADREQWWAAVERTGKRGGRRRVRAASPYRGFEVFTQDDAERFFGRDEVITSLVELVQSQADEARRTAGDGGPDVTDAVLRRAVLVVGVSGVGKSSLVRAGLYRETQPGGRLAGSPVAVMAPGSAPIEALEAAVAELGPDNPEVPGLLVMDQFEELWTLNSAVVSVAFGQRLGELLGGRLVIPVITLRADFYASATENGGLAQAAARAQIVVPRMSEAQLREVIVRPGEAAGATVDDDLVELLLKDLAPAGSGGRVDSGVLPLLSHALRATWEVSDGRHLGVGDYLKTGRIDGAVEQTAEEVYGDLSDEEQHAAHRLLLDLVNVDEDTVARRALDLDEVHGEAATRVIEAFADARLLTVSSSRVQVAHEALLRAWPRLTGWIADDRERLLLHRRLRALTDPWDANGRPDDLLPSRSRLEMFAPLVDADDGLDRAGRDYLEAGRQRLVEQDDAERRRARQLRRIALAAVAFGVVAILAAVAAVIAGINARNGRNEAINSRSATLSRQLAIQATQLAERDPMLAGQLAMVAYQHAPTVEARSTLIDTLADGIPTRFSGDGGTLLLARSGSLLAASSASGQVRLFRIGDPVGDGPAIEKQVGEFRAVEGKDENLGGLALLPDGKTLLLGGQNKIALWDVSDSAHPKAIGQLPGVRGDANTITTSPNGAYVASANLGSGLQVWRHVGDDWRPVAIPGDAGTVSGAVAFSPNGAILASSTINRRVDLWAVDGDSLRHIGEIDLGWRDNQLAQGLTFSADGKELFAALRSRTIGVWNVADPAAPVREPDFEGFTSYVSSVSLAPDGKSLVAAGADNTVRVFSLDNRGAAPRVLPTAANSSSSLIVGDHVVMASDDGRVQDWPPMTDRTWASKKTVFQIPVAAQAGRLLAADTEVDGRITQWVPGPEGLRRGGPDLLPPKDAVFSGAVVISPDARTAAMGSVSGTVYFADYSNPDAPAVIGSVKAGDGLNETVDYSPASGLAVTGGTDQRELIVIDAKNPRAPRRVGSFDAGSGVWWASLSPDGTTAAVATNTGQVRLVDLRDPAHPRAYPDPLRFDGSALAVRFSADGKRIVATSEDKSVKVADISDPDNATEVAVMSGPAGQLYSAAFSPDGRRIVAGGGNSEIWVWSLDEDGAAAEEVVLRSFPGTVFDVRFTGNDEILASGQDGLIESWRLDSNDLIGRECARPGDRINNTEWNTYIPGVPFAPPC